MSNIHYKDNYSVKQFKDRPQHRFETNIIGFPQSWLACPQESEIKSLPRLGPFSDMKANTWKETFCFMQTNKQTIKKIKHNNKYFLPQYNVEDDATQRKIAQKIRQLCQMEMAMNERMMLMLLIKIMMMKTMRHH